MKWLAIMILAVALGAMAACGGKSKTKPAAPAPTTESIDADDSDTEQPGEVDEPGSQPARDSAKLHEIIYFEFDSSELGEDARRALDENYEWLREDPTRTLTIEGHTDEVGTSEYNLGLGERRARAAQEYLVRMGIDASRIDIITYGEERPAAEGDARNRRSVFVATRK